MKGLITTLYIMAVIVILIVMMVSHIKMGTDPLAIIVRLFCMIYIGKWIFKDYISKD